MNITKKKYSFYSYEDIKFRFVRDFFLSKEAYENTMILMLKKYKADIEKLKLKLFFNEKDILKLNGLGHVIGLHSHTHPTKIEKLSYNEQNMEYSKNLSNLTKILKKKSNFIKSCSHPCGSYNYDTLEILKELGVELGFKQIMTIEPAKGMKKLNNSFLEIARQNHSEIYKKMN